MNKDFIEIVEAAKTGDARAFEALYNMTKDSGYFIALSITKNEQDAIDILQDSYIKAFEKLGTLKQPELFDNWLNRIVSNNSKNYVMKKKPMLFADITEDIPNEWKEEEVNKDYIPHETVDSKETSRLIMEMINKLSEEKRLVILMYYFQEMSVAEISKTLELPVTTVKYKLLSARQDIKKDIISLEKKGTKLYSIAPLAILPAALTMSAGFYSAPAYASVSVASTSGAVSSSFGGSGSSFGGSGSSSGEGSSSSGVSNSSSVGSNAALGENGSALIGNTPSYLSSGLPTKAGFLSTLAGKATIAVVAAAVVGGTVFAIASSNQKGDQSAESSQSVISSEVNSEDKEHTNSRQDTEVKQEESKDAENTQNTAPVTDFEYREIDDGQNIEITKYIGSDTEVVIPSEIEGKPVTSLGESAFEDLTGITSVTIPDSVKKIGYYVFQNCSSLSEIKIPKDDIVLGIDVFTGTAWYESQPEGMVYMENIAYKYKGDMPKNTTIILEEGTRTIAGACFYNCENLVEITLPDGLISIGNYAFANCTSLKSIDIPQGITEIPMFAFKGSNSLEHVTLPKSLEIINCSAFEDCAKIKNITIPDGVTGIMGLAFKDCVLLESVVLPDSITEIQTAFEGCTSLVSVKLPENENYTRIAGGIFENCTSLKEIVIPDNVTTIGDKAFSNCTSLESITIPESVTMLSLYAFRNCSSLETVNIQGKIKTIYNGLFYECTSLKNVTIPESVERIDYCAFKGCTSLQKLTIPANVTTFEKDVFKGCSSSFILYGTAGSAAEEYANENEITFVAE